MLTTARHKALDRLRRNAVYRDKLSLLVGSQPGDIRSEEDDRLRLIFTCCHPALGREAQVALTLRAVIGLTTAEIARAFLTSEATMAQRIVRAKRKIVAAGIPYRIPDANEIEGRLAEVLAVLYLTFNEGYLSSSGITHERRELAEDAVWLTRLLMRLMPGEPEIMGLLALMRLQLARAASRFDAAGGLVLLQDQDRSGWDRGAIDEAARLLSETARINRDGPYQLQAAIAACHAQAATWEETDWPRIVELYESLLQVWPSPVVRLNRAVALRYVAGPAAALEELDALNGALHDYHLFHASRAQMLRALHRDAEARDADQRALTLTANPAERAIIERRLVSS